MDGKNAFQDQNLSPNNLALVLKSLEVRGLSAEPGAIPPPGSSPLQLTHHTDPGYLTMFLSF